MRKHTILAATAAIALFANFAQGGDQPETPKLDTPLLMVGDSMMRLLGIAMEKQFKKEGIQPAVAFSSLGSGLVRPAAFDWNAKMNELCAQHHPKTVFVSIGTNDGQTLEGNEGVAIRYGAPEWEPEYAKRLTAFIDNILDKDVDRIVWFLLPAMKDPGHNEHALLVNRLVTEIAQDESRKDKMTLFDLGPVLSRHPGKFAPTVMSPTGAALTVRDPDGVHLTNDGAKLIARAVIKTFWGK